jgi:hypothetical protein
MSKIICTNENHRFHTIKKQNIFKNSKFVQSPCLVTEVSSIWFGHCQVFAFPNADAIRNHAIKIDKLYITYSNLAQVTANDLKAFTYLKVLVISHCELEELPGDLFKFTPDLEQLNFNNNKIKYIGEGILKPLRSFSFFGLAGNTNIDYIYCLYTNKGSIKELTEMVNALDKRKEIAFLKRKAEDAEAEKANLQKRLKSAEETISDLKKKFEEIGNFALKLNEKEFKVNKKFLKAHSKAVERLIEQNPDADSFELHDIGEEAMKELLNYVYTGNVPKENANFVDLFNASCQLEADALSSIVAEILKDKVNPENSLEVLLLCNKFKGYEELKMKAFSEFGKNFPNQKLKPEWASKSEKLKKFLKVKLEMDKTIAELNEID